MRVKMKVWASREEELRAVQVIVKVVCSDLSPKVVLKISERFKQERLSSVPVTEVQRKALLWEKSFHTPISVDTPYEDRVSMNDLTYIWTAYDEILDLDFVDYNMLSTTTGLSNEELSLCGIKLLADILKSTGEPREY